MSVEIIVRANNGTYTARAIGHKATASRSEGARQAAMALLLKLNLSAGQLQEQPATDLPYRQQRFCFVSNSEMTECQFHSNCGGWCETQRELEHNLCKQCLETHDEQLALHNEQLQGEPVVQYPNRLCHIEPSAHPYLCGCLKGDEEAQKIYDDYLRWKGVADCAICKDLGDQCLECEEADFVRWAERHFAKADYRKTAAGIYQQDWMRHAFAAWQARGALSKADAKN